MQIPPELRAAVLRRMKRFGESFFEALHHIQLGRAVEEENQ